MFAAFLQRSFRCTVYRGQRSDPLASCPCCFALLAAFLCSAVFWRGQPLILSCCLLLAAFPLQGLLCLQRSQHSDPLAQLIVCLLAAFFARALCAEVKPRSSGTAAHVCCALAAFFAVHCVAESQHSDPLSCLCLRFLQRSQVHVLQEMSDPLAGYIVCLPPSCSAPLGALCREVSTLISLTAAHVFCLQRSFAVHCVAEVSTLIL
jgi:hypothetical protein